MVEFNLIVGELYNFDKQLTEFFKKYPDAVLVNIDLSKLRALAMYEVDDE